VGAQSALVDFTGYGQRIAIYGFISLSFTVARDSELGAKLIEPDDTGWLFGAAKIKSQHQQNEQSIR
jgi:hypothetical protein